MCDWFIKCYGKHRKSRLLVGFPRNLLFFLFCASAAFIPKVLASDDEFVILPFVGVSANYQFVEDYSFDFEEPSELGLGVLAGLELPNNFYWDVTYEFDSVYVAPETNIEIKSPTLETGIRYEHYLDNDWYGYGRVGVAYWKVNKNNQVDSYTYEVDESGFSPLIELGIGYAMLPSLSLSVGYKYVNSIGGDITGSFEEHSLIAGARFTFFDGEREDNESVEQYLSEIKQQDSESINDKNRKQVIFMSFDSANFAVNSSHINSYDRYNFRKLISFLKNNQDATVRVVGHTDSTGSAYRNKILSLDRARSVYELLVINGISSNRIFVSGDGEENPIASNSTVEGRAKNRRVDVIIPDFSSFVK